MVPTGTARWSNLSLGFWLGLALGLGLGKVGPVPCSRYRHQSILQWLWGAVVWFVWICTQSWRFCVFVFDILGNVLHVRHYTTLSAEKNPTTSRLLFHRFHFKIRPVEGAAEHSMHAENKEFLEPRLLRCNKQPTEWATESWRCCKRVFTDELSFQSYGRYPIQLQLRWASPALSLDIHLALYVALDKLFSQMMQSTCPPQGQ